jgi:hypothetical protein
MEPKILLLEPTRPHHDCPGVLAYNLTRIMNIVGVKPLVAAIAA